MNFLLQIGIFVLVLTWAWFTFRVVAQDYAHDGKLNVRSSILETAIFFIHGVSSYAFLDSSIGNINTKSALFYIALGLMAVGLPLVLISMSGLGFGISIGRKPEGLHRKGLYRFTRNPQIVSYFLVVLGYAMLWPSWSGGLWVLLYALIAHRMVRTEEAHLHRTFGVEYDQYFESTPRYLIL